MTPELQSAIDRLKALLPKITQGEWSVVDIDRLACGEHGLLYVDGSEGRSCFICTEDAEFIALAHNAMPALIAELELLSESVAIADRAAVVLAEELLKRDAELARYRQRAPGMAAGLTLDPQLGTWDDDEAHDTLDLGEGKLREDGE